jgi:putative membrane protein
MMREALAAAGLIVLALIWIGPLPGLAAHSFSAHMTMHMGVVAVAAPLLALAVAGGRYDPARRWPAAFNAIGAAIVELVVVWGWHAPVLHRAARTSSEGLVAEQTAFLAAALYAWVASCGGSRDQSPARAASGIVALLLISMHMTLLGALLALSPRPLYDHDASVPHALEDQHLGGAIMLIAGTGVYLAGGLWLSTRLLIARDPRTGRRATWRSA